MEKKEWVLLAISCVEKDYLSPVQLQKTLFLLKENKPSAVGKNFYEFIPYNYGPFSKDIYSDTEFLASEGLIKFTMPIGQRWIGYTLTEKGKQQVKTLQKEANKNDLDYLSKIVKWIKGLSFKQLLSAIYKAYPKYKVNSVFPEL